jgi:hypothetical protein
MSMTHNFESIDLAMLTQVAGGKQQQPPPQPQPRQQPQPRPADDSQWIRNTVKCARVGGPLLGALCGVLTPSPAY